MKRIKLLFPLLFVVVIVTFSCSSDDEDEEQDEITVSTTLDSSETITNNKLSVQLDYRGPIYLENNITADWTAEYKKPYQDAVNKWLSALKGIEGTDSHTIIISVIVQPLNNGDGQTSPTSDKTIGTYTFPATGEIFIGAHTYTTGFNQTEFNANILHELGHIFGIGSYTEKYTTHSPIFKGNVFRIPNSKGAQYYNEIYNVNYDMVPMSANMGHLYDNSDEEDVVRVLDDGSTLPPLTKEFMTNGTVFGKVSLGVYDDLGYIIDYTVAEEYDPFSD